MTLIDEFRAKELLKALADNQQTMSSLHEVAGGSAANTMAGLASLGGNGLFLGKVSDDRLGKVFANSMVGDRHHAFTTARSKSSASTAIVHDRGDAGRPAQHEHLLGACREMVAGRCGRRTGGRRPRPLYRRLSVGRGKGQAGLAQGHRGGEGRGRAHRPVAVRSASASAASATNSCICWTRMSTSCSPMKTKPRRCSRQKTLTAWSPAAKKWGGIAALTRSAKGCVIVEEGMVHEIPAAPVGRVIDTTGAGDQFAAGFLYGLTHGKGLPDCGRLGALAAAEVISHYGARPETSLKDLAAKAGLTLIADEDAASLRAGAARRDARTHKSPARCPAPACPCAAECPAESCVSAARICEGMSSGPSAVWRKRGPLLARWAKKSCRSFCTSGSAFSWISSEAEVWRMKQVSSPSAILASRTKSATASVHS